MLLARRFRKEIDAALELDSRDVQALRDLLEFYVLAPGIIGGDTKKAEAIAQQIASIDVPEGYLAKARIAELQKDRARQEAMLRRGADSQPFSYKAQMALAQFYSMPEHTDRAAAESLGRRALTLDSGRVGAYCVLATIYAGQADWSALETLLSSAARAVPDDAAPYYRAAEQLLSDNREPARAERYLRVYLAQEPEGNQPSAAEARAKLALAVSAPARARQNSARIGGAK